MNFATTIAADTKTPEVVEPRLSAFYHPAEFAQTASEFGSTPHDHRPDAAITHALAMCVGVVAAHAAKDLGAAVGVYKDVMLRTWSPTIRRVCSNLPSAPTARTEEASTAAYEKPGPVGRIRAAGADNASRLRPAPDPSAVGKWFHRTPVRNTKRAPLSAARSKTRGLPFVRFCDPLGSAMTLQSVSTIRCQ